ncbi:MAG: NAD(P)-dependent dehydrogenase (short-subunit alcohol dehydrogenase family) [Colwellia sp.]|jgi:NAD(P)-dependent dehydrogenase (short-subunit alcohol dehydrogenase family)
MSTQRDGLGGVNVSSGAARFGSPNKYIDYVASKGAINTLTKGLSLKVAAEGIQVNCVRPGLTYTNYIKFVSLLCIGKIYQGKALD